MLILISPAKTLDFESPAITQDSSQPLFPEEAEKLVRKLRTLSRKKIRELMSISPNLAQLNFERYLSFGTENSLANTKQALFAFRGDVYLGLEAETFTEEDVAFAQDHLRILSGLYGILRPLDRIEPYRLEMGTKLPVRRKKNLYEFWGTTITEAVNEALETQGDDIVINLASNEYWSAVKPEKVKGRILTINFKDWKNGQYKFLSFFAKKARGAMSQYIIKNRVSTLEDLKDFDWEGYGFNADLSEGDSWIFTRKIQD